MKSQTAGDVVVDVVVDVDVDVDVDVAMAVVVACSASHTAPIISAIEREPGSTWPSARSPKNEARPRLASMWAVAAALA